MRPLALISLLLLPFMIGLVQDEDLPEQEVIEVPAAAPVTEVAPTAVLSVPTLAPPPPSAPAAPAPPPAQSACCRVCTTGKACGNTCIAANRNCNAGPGCACNGLVAPAFGEDIDDLVLAVALPYEEPLFDEDDDGDECGADG